MKPDPKADPTSSEMADTGAVMDYFRSQLQQIVMLHTTMFEKLLFDSTQPVPLELAELFEEAGNRYLDISEKISCRYMRAGDSEIEESLDAAVKATGRWIEP